MSAKKLNERINLRIEKAVKKWLEEEAERQHITDGSEMARKILREAMNKEAGGENRKNGR